MSAAEKSIREELESAMQGEPGTVETDVVEAVEPEARADERARDERGRFVAKPAEVETVDAPQAEQADTAVKPDAVVEGSAEREVPQAAEPALAPPNGWTAEAKAKWHELPQEVQSAVQKREQDVAKFTSTRDEHASFGKEMYQTVQPYMAQIQAEGGTPATAIKALLNTAYVLRVGSPEQKKQLLIQTARQFGVDLGQPQQSDVPPGLETLQQRIDRLEREAASEKETANQRMQAEVQTELETFAADPKHPHFETVKGHMAALIAQGAAKDLQDAYEQAVWARPDTRATLLAQQRAEEEQKRRAEAKARADKARELNHGITGGPGNTAQASAPEGRSIREELEAAVAAQSGGV